jgi:hypothetical protein
MDTDPATNRLIECMLDNDARLIAGVGALAAHVARRAGLSDRGQKDLEEAVVDACRQAFQVSGRMGRARAAIRLDVASFADRVEVTVEYPEKRRAAARPALRGRRVITRRTGRIAPSTSTLVDRIERTRHDGRCRMTLVKYCGAVKSSSKA